MGGHASTSHSAPPPWQMHCVHSSSIHVSASAYRSPWLPRQRVAIDGASFFASDSATRERESAASRSRVGRESVACQSRVGRESVASQSRVSRESAASQLRVSRESVASHWRVSCELVASQWRVSRESTASRSRVSRESAASRSQVGRESVASQPWSSGIVSSNRVCNLSP